jgi:hypothetical protein
MASIDRIPVCPDASDPVSIYIVLPRTFASSYVLLAAFFVSKKSRLLPLLFVPENLPISKAVVSGGYPLSHGPGDLRESCVRPRTTPFKTLMDRAAFSS